MAIMEIHNKYWIVLIAINLFCDYWTNYIQKYNFLIKYSSISSILVFIPLSPILNNYKYYYKSLDKYVLLIEYKKFKSYQESLFCKDYKQLLLDIKLGKYTKK